MIRFGVSDGGDGVFMISETFEEALQAALRAVKTDGIRRWVVRIATVKKVTSGALGPPPEPIVEDE